MPDYFVPPSHSSNSNGIADADDVRCPRCASTRLFPTSQIETRMKIYQCGQCGARYRLRPRVPTWSETFRDPMVIAGAIIFLLIVIAVML